jgi:hypothetical protein
MGDRLAGPAMLEARAVAPPGATLVLLRNGVEVATAAAGIQHDASDEPAAYRIEVRLPGAPGRPPVPWIVSNPIYVGAAAERGPELFSAPVDMRAVPAEVGPRGWRVERDEGSKGGLEPLDATPGFTLHFQLAASEAAQPYVAAVRPLGAEVAAFTRLMFIGRADRPRRVSVQLRVPGTGDGTRWERSVYLDREPRQIVVRFEELRAAEEGGNRPELRQVDSLLFVIDTVHTPARTSGTIRIEEVRLER